MEQSGRLTEEVRSYYTDCGKQVGKKGKLYVNVLSQCQAR